MPGTAETFIKVLFIVLFLLYVYFMMGDYTQCSIHSPHSGYFGEKNHCPAHQVNHLNHQTPAHESNQLNGSYLNKNIYQMGPYLTI